MAKFETGPTNAKQTGTAYAKVRGGTGIRQKRRRGLCQSSRRDRHAPMRNAIYQWESWTLGGLEEGEGLFQSSNVLMGVLKYRRNPTPSHYGGSV